MKISLQWLNDYLPGVIEIGAQRCADVLMSGGLPVETIEPAGSDTVLDVEVTSNRADCLSHVGVARELAALLNRPFKPVTPAITESGTAAAGATSVAIQAADLCSYYSARLIQGVKIGPSPAWLVQRLEAIGLRSVNNVVDVTNYVLMELGQPLHAFDFDKLQGRQIIVRRAAKGEKLISIDGKTRELDPEMLVIADAKNPVALAGVMGGKDSEVSSSTTSILLESARFDPLSIRKTSRALALRSDSSYRFERGIDPTLADLASRRAAELIVQTAGGQILQGHVSAGSAQYAPRKVTLNVPRIRALLGIDIPASEAADVLRRLGFGPEVAAEKIECTVPSWRQDVSIEVDLIEEVARAVGYDRIPVRHAIEINLTPPQSDLRAIDKIRAAAVAAGYYEALTFSWVSDNLRDDFKPAQAAGLLRAAEAVRKDNAHLRPSMLPGLLEAVRRNQTVGNGHVKLFEIGSTFWIDAKGKTDERRRLAYVGSADYREVRGAVEALLNSLNASLPIRITPTTQPGLSHAATGVIEWNGQPIGHIGRIDAGVANKLDLRQPPFAAELELEPLINNVQWLPQVKELAKFPSIKRDLSLVVSEKVRYEEIENVVTHLKLPDLEGVQYVTTYRGKPIPAGQKSVTIELLFRSETATLTSEAVEQSVQQTIAQSKEKLGAELRV